MKTSFDKKVILFFMRLTMGWMFLYAGYTKIIDPTWSAKSYIEGSKVFPQFFNLLLGQNILPRINLLNEWGLLLIGVALITGAFVRFASFFGFVLMILYYLPIYPPKQAYIVDMHIIYALMFLLFMAIPVGTILGLDALFEKSNFTKKHGWFRALLG